jgi:ABC-2 type transport system permease protein
MKTIFLKEIQSFFSSLIGYVVIGVFVLMLGLIIWVFPDFSILNNNYATLDQLFSLSPMIFLFLIPAITMRSFSEEIQYGTLELRMTKPIHDASIVAGKFFACLALVCIALLPSLLYFYSVYQLGSPKGNIDVGAIGGSYIGLFMLAASFTAIGLYCSTLFKNQIVSFLVAMAGCYVFYFGFFFLSKLPVFFGKTDDLIQKIGMDYHYNALSKGLVDLRDIVYFLSIIFLFLYLTVESLKTRKV